MISGGRPVAARGFTIVETLIVLAVTGFLLVSAMALINGKQARTDFQTGINNLRQQIQQIINETASGYYPNHSDFSCSGSDSGGPVTLSNLGSNAQGTNATCIFLGKALQFGSNSDVSQLSELPIVGNQYFLDANGKRLVETLTEASPRAAYQSSASDSAPTTTLSTTEMEYGLSIATSNGGCGVGMGGMCYMDSSGTAHPTGLAAFVAGDSTGALASYDASGELNSGTQQLSLYGVAVSGTKGTPNESVADAAAAIGNVTVINPTGLRPATSVLICVASATTDQSGLLTISGNGSLGVKLDIKGNTTCA